MIEILLALVGVTGVGKSYYKNKIVEKLGFDKIKIITTREIRTGEKNNDDKIFVTNEELNQLEKEGKIAYKFELLGNIYAYSKEALFTDKDTVFELHYAEIFNFKKICPDICSIYLMPRDVEIAKQKLKERHLKQETENKRILEIDEHYNRIKTDKELTKMFDYFVYNDYNEKSEQDVINLVQKLVKEKGK